MARSRNIKPGFFKNYDLADAGPFNQLLFAGLWCMADREGRLEDKPRFIKAELFPYYEFDVNGGLTVLERLKFICRYEVAGEPIIQVNNFKKHQSPHNTEKASVLPTIDFSDKKISTNTIGCKGNGGLTVNSPLHNDGNPPDSLIPDSLIPDSLIPDSLIPDSLIPDSLIPDSLIPDSLIPDSLIPETKESPNNQPTQLAIICKREKPKIDKASQDEMFSQFYSAYPKKTGRADAEKSWSKIDPNLYQKIIDDTKHRSLNHQPWLGDKQFINAPSVWLNGQRWDDEVIYPTASKSQNKATARVDDLKNAMLTFVAKNESGQDQNLLENSTSISQEPAKFFRGAEINTEASH